MMLRFAERYLLQGLGQGMSSTAYQGTYGESNQSCLVLVLHVPSHCSTQARSRFYMRFERHVQALLALPAHPALVGLRDAGIWKDQPYLVFPEAALMPSLLSSFTVPCSPTQAVRIILPVAQGLAHAHAHGITHGNVSLSLLLGTPASVMLAGLGLRALLEAQGIEDAEMPYAHLRTLWGTYLGDPYAMAPECVLGQKPDEQSDLYGLGIVLCQLMRRPYVIREQSFIRLAVHCVYDPPVLSERSVLELDSLLSTYPYKRTSANEVVSWCQKNL